MKTTLSSLRELFEQLRHRPFVIVEQGGNWGDGLIWWGAQHLAKQAGVSFRCIDFPTLLKSRFDREEVVYLNGGGGFNQHASRRAEKALVHAVSTHPGVVIQGPQTFENSEDYAREVFQKLGESVCAERLVVWTREPTSFDLVTRTAPDWIELGLDWDTALHLDRETYLARSGPVPATYDLLGIREDNEVFRGREFSQFEGVLLDPALYADSFEHWLRLHAGARRIITSRTHSAIAGAILKKPTIILPGSYHKNRSIWEYVLAERGVVWGENLEAPSFARRAKSLLRNKVLSLSRFSYKVNRFTMRALGVPD